MTTLNKYHAFRVFPMDCSALTDASPLVEHFGQVEANCLEQAVNMFEEHTQSSWFDIVVENECSAHRLVPGESLTWENDPTIYHIHLVKEA